MTITRTLFAPVVAIGLLASCLSVESASAKEGVDLKGEKKINEVLAGLSAEDQKLAKAQRFWPMNAHSRLGAMGEPVKVTIAGKPVFICCEGCVASAKKGGKKTLTAAKKLTTASATLAKLSPKERVAAEAQKYCAVANTSLLGSMGAPIKLEFDGKPVYLCCKGCETKAKSNPTATLAKVEELRKAGKPGAHKH